MKNNTHFPELEPVQNLVSPPAKMDGFRETKRSVFLIHEHRIAEK
jgi:hypothetical protein